MAGPLCGLQRSPDLTLDHGRPLLMGDGSETWQVLAEEAWAAGLPCRGQRCVCDVVASGSGALGAQLAAQENGRSALRQKPIGSRPDFAGVRTARAANSTFSWLGPLDRLGRSLQDLVSFLEEIGANGIDLYLHVPGVDTTTPVSRAVFQMLGVFAEFERSIIQERIHAGLDRARTRGVRLGRPPALKRLAERRIIAARAAAPRSPHAPLLVSWGSPSATYAAFLPGNGSERGAHDA